MNEYNKYKMKRHLVFFSALLFITVLSTYSISYSSLPEKEIQKKYVFFNPVIEKLKAGDVDSSFIYYLLSDPSTKFNEKYVKINVTGYLKKSDYSHHYNDFSVKKSVDFLKTNYKILDKCQKKYGVPKEVITSVIWIETKHGNYLGKHHIPSVFLSTAMADREKYIKINKKKLHKSYNGSKNKLPALEKKIEKRASKKSKWAINEIKYLEKIHKARQVDILNLIGSWAGAFGLSQFLPSSYKRWAVDGNDDGVIDLFNIEDAIYSVANYLKVNGWGSTKEKQEKAVYHYNNSKAYVNAVLTLAEKVKKRFSEFKNTKQQNPK